MWYIKKCIQMIKKEEQLEVPFLCNVQYWIIDPLGCHQCCGLIMCIINSNWSSVAVQPTGKVTENVGFMRGADRPFPQLTLLWLCWLVCSSSGRSSTESSEESEEGECRHAADADGLLSRSIDLAVIDDNASKTIVFKPLPGVLVNLPLSFNTYYLTALQQ